MIGQVLSFYFFFFNDTATTEIYTLSLHDALPISKTQSALLMLKTWDAVERADSAKAALFEVWFARHLGRAFVSDRKSTRLNSSHSQISYAVFCLKKKKSPVVPRPASTITRPPDRY